MKVAGKAAIITGGGTGVGRATALALAGLAGDDEAASGAIAALRRAGKRVPEDVAVVGFDDSPIAHYLAPLPLTTVRAPIEEAGLAAARQLAQLIRTGQADPLVLLPTKLVIRRSCGCG